MKARDFIQTLEYMKTFSAAKEAKRRRKTRKPDADMAILLSRLSAADLLNLLADKERDAQILSQFLKDKEKINKKDDDKKKDGTLNLQQMQTFLIFIAIIAPFYAKWLFH